MSNSATVDGLATKDISVEPTTDSNKFLEINCVSVTMLIDVVFCRIRGENVKLKFHNT